MKLNFPDPFGKKRKLPKFLRDVNLVEKSQALDSGAAPPAGRNVQARARSRANGGLFSTKEAVKEVEEQRDGVEWQNEYSGEAAGDDGSSEADEDDDNEQEKDAPANQLAYSKDLAIGYFDGMAASLRARGTLLAAERVALRCAVTACGSSPQPCPTCGGFCNPDKVPRCTISIITWAQPVVVDVPLHWCSTCKADFSIKPTQVNCLPDTVVSWDLRLRRNGSNILWWHNSVLQQYALLSYYTKHISADGFCGAMMTAWEENGVQPLELPPRQGVSVIATGPPPPLTHAMLRQRLRPAINAYYNLFGLTADYPETLAHWPAGAANGCPCCGDANCSYGTPAAAAADMVARQTATELARTTEGIPTAAVDVSVVTGMAGSATAAGVVQAIAVMAGAASAAAVVAGAAAAAAVEPSTVAAAAAAAAAAASSGDNVAATEVACAAVRAALAAETAATDAAAASTAAATAVAGNAAALGADHATMEVAAAGTGPSGALVPPQYDHHLVAIGLAGLLLLLGHWPDYGVEKAGPGPRRIHSCHFDGCFRLNLLKRRGYTPGYAQLPYRRYFISNQVMADLDKSSTVHAVDMSKCSTFHADKVLAPESQKNLVTAVGVVVCRHGMLLRLMNFFRGERHFYSIAAIQSLMAVGTAVHFWWYDIACRWSKSFDKWLQNQKDPAILDKGRAVVNLIPPWHRYAHSYACQKQFGHTRQAGVGRGTGEPAEVVNSVLGPHGAITRYMSPANREAHIEHIARRYCGQVLLGLPARMWRMNVRATAVQRAMEQRIRSIEATLGDEKQQVISEVERLMQQGQDADDAPDEAPSPSYSWRAEYVRCRMILQKLEGSDEVDAEGDVLPLSTLYHGADSLTVRQRPHLIKTLRAKVVQLEGSHVDISLSDWRPGSVDFQAALVELAESEISQLGLEIEGAVLDFHSLEQVVASLATRKKEQDLAKKEKFKASGRLQQLWGRLRQWSVEQSARGMLSVEQATRNTAITSHGAYKRVLHEHFPWNPRVHSRGMPRVIAVLLRCRHELARCGEELRLVRAEVAGALTYFGHRVRLLGDCLARITNESERIILSGHLKLNQRMLYAFEQLSTSDAYIPEDVSYTGAHDKD